MFVQFSIFVLSICQIVLATDYCDKSLCNGKGKHVACKNNGQFAKSCPRDIEIVNSSEIKDAIVNKHNEFRNFIALGKNPKFPTATRMATMQWDDELAKLAELNVKRCVFAHDQCYSTKKYPYAGQNIVYWYMSPNQGTGVDEKGVQMWFDEHKKCNKNDLIKLNLKKCGHFSEIMNEENIRVGCGVTKSKQDGYIKYSMACNYAYTNFVPSYTFGSTAKDCKTGKNPKYPGLCSVKEEYSLAPKF